MGDLFGPLTQGGLVVIPPIRFHEDGTETFSLFSLDTEIQAAIETVPNPVDVIIEEKSGLDATAATVETRLSKRQRETIEAAVKLGYYEIPRKASHTGVAAEIGCVPSTPAEHLQKVESKLRSSIFGT